MLSEKFRLTGKTALITGSSQGIGQGIAAAFAEYGANVIIHSRNDPQEAEATAVEVRKYAVKADIIAGDLTKPGAAEKLYEDAIAAAGQIDILVLNASVQIPKLWSEVTPQDFDDQVTANVRSSFFLMQKCGPGMAERGWGRILTIGSVQQEKPHPAMPVYAATKSAVLNLVQNFAMQLADRGVTVNNLAPGVIGTQRIEQDVPETAERINKRLETPSGQIGAPEDCATLAVLLCSEAGRFITGQNINVDGGMSL
ncbi:SDR family NAD(P)-dependent oxidoreductase [Dyadobacter sandarakinus]|uniref:SDR family oxidoreductase n=1 Tax=Dyadobacter sandarakinus TaxID=2747268 RepID=A0ABX7I496_9BACT|nr:SDR family oxidoreductase [Dyadobacter sandarakinus]QRR00916.1 SDR family oxidoreductase [Dyadobacter sandarakinus]